MVQNQKKKNLISFGLSLQVLQKQIIFLNLEFFDKI
jgi:hypothetical protein